MRVRMSLFSVQYRREDVMNEPEQGPFGPFHGSLELFIEANSENDALNLLAERIGAVLGADVYPTHDRRLTPEEPK